MTALYDLAKKLTTFAMLQSQQGDFYVIENNEIKI
jgi:hypothetical protein